MTHPKALTIAGSDSGGGAGIQADLKTFSALGVYGASVITSVTAQNTLTVSAIQDIFPEIIAAQIEAVMSDIKPYAVKTGMLSQSAIIEVVSAAVKRFKIKKLVVDPVMISKSGAKLLQDSAIQKVISDLVPFAHVITPNIPEAEILTQMQILTIKDMQRAAKKIRTMGARNVIVKGGHLKKDAVDVLLTGKEFIYLKGVRIHTKNTHGTGCTFSAALTAFLAKGADVVTAASHAKAYIQKAIEHAYPVGKGHGPVNHFFQFKKRAN